MSGDCIKPLRVEYPPLYKLRDKSSTTKQGTSAYCLVTCLEGYNFDVTAVQADESVWDNPEMIYPAIAHVTLENGMMHYVVVYKFEGAKFI